MVEGKKYGMRGKSKNAKMFDNFCEQTQNFMGNTKQLRKKITV